MQRYFIYLSYDGAAYHGWQVQPNGITVQSCIEKALSTILRQQTPITGAGRTDTGVNARLMVAHVDLELDNTTPQQLADKLNSLLPRDIAINKIVPVNPEAHSRFDALSRTYHYYLIDHKEPFLERYAMRIRGELDVEKMNLAALKLFDYTDFTSFSKLHTDVKTNNCQIMQAQWVDEGERLVFVVQADRFLRNMVRAIVGTLLEVGRGRMGIDEFCRVIEQKDRCKAGNSVPAQGLFLWDVAYPENLFL